MTKEVVKQFGGVVDGIEYSEGVTFLSLQPLTPDDARQEFAIADILDKGAYSGRLVDFFHTINGTLLHRTVTQRIETADFSHNTAAIPMGAWQTRVARARFYREET